MAADTGGAALMLKTTSALNNAVNDTGRVAYCGPYVVSAITGYPVSDVEEQIRIARRSLGTGEATCDKIVGTTADEVRYALWTYGYAMERVQDYMRLERKARPTLLGWMQRPRNAWAHYILAIHKGREGHWIVIKGVKCSDTYSGGKWQFVVDGPHRGAKIMEVFTVRRDLAAG
jgi:hypothetical protein